MNVVASLLRAKHWQIFFLLFGIFIVGDVAVMSSMSAAARSPQDFAKIGPLFGAATAEARVRIFSFCPYLPGALHIHIYRVFSECQH